MLSRTVPQMLVESIIHDIHTVRWLGADEITSVATSVVEGGAGTRMIIATCRLGFHPTVRSCCAWYYLIKLHID